MKCNGCGFCIVYKNAPEDLGCAMCGQPLTYETEDFLLHGANGLVKEVRAGQVEMGRLIEKTIDDKAFALIEGPVGIGKSYAYLLPSILSGNRVVISTAKKQLQHQIARKDIPHLAKTLGREIPVALLKGKSNYACRIKAYDLPQQHKPDFLKWMDTAEFADLTEYPGKRPFFWGDVTAEDCLGTACRMRGQCGYWKAKQQMKTAQVIIANHHVTAFDLRYGPGKMLGPYQTLVIDEAHQAPSAFRGAYAKTIAPWGARKLLKLIDRAGITTGLEKTLTDKWAALFTQIEGQDGEIPKDPFGAAGEEVVSVLETLKSATKRELAALGRKPDEDEGAEELDAGEGGSGQLSGNWEDIANHEMLFKALERYLQAFKSAKAPDPNTVVYITTNDKKMQTVNIAPITIGTLVGPRMHALDSVIVTSATIAINGSFEDIKYQMGMNLKPKAPEAPTGVVSIAQSAANIAATQLAEEAAKKKTYEKVLETPFNYNRQALLYTPKHIPMPEGPTAAPQRREAYMSALTNDIRKLLLASDGNAFVLFTSGIDLAEVHQRLLEEDMNGLTLIPQGDDAEACFKQYMATPRSSILGLKSFWEGVDVQGDKLRLVIITKLPFPMVSDPVIQARSRTAMNEALERGLNEATARGEVFRRIQVPIMLTDLRQGAGRLIRSKTDKGVLAILDPRIWTGSGSKLPSAGQGYEGYGAQAVKGIGFGQTTSDFALTERILVGLRKQAESKGS